MEGYLTDFLSAREREEKGAERCRKWLIIALRWGLVYVCKLGCVCRVSDFAGMVGGAKSVIVAVKSFKMV